MKYAPDRLDGVVSADVTVREEAIKAGRVILRYTDRTSSNDVTVPLPCHERQHVVIADRNEPEQLALCRQCVTAYAVTLIDENDGGFLAELVVWPDDAVLLSRARTTPTP